MPTLTEVAEAVTTFGGNPQKAEVLASVLGFQPYHTPADLLGGQITPLKKFLDTRFGIRQLFRVGGTSLDSGPIGFYVAVLDSWGARSSDRDRPRRRLARALTEGYLPDARSFFIMVPPQLQRATEAEFVLPRSSADLRQGKAANAVSTIRALVELQEPSRFHRELLAELAIGPGASMLGVSQQWQHAFSVEKATRKFYQEYAGVRDRIAAVLKSANPSHPGVQGLTADQARAWATRQLGRILFLWFLQSKLWLGYNWSTSESSKYLLTLWGRRNKVEGGFYQGILRPIFFKALASRSPGDEVRELLGYTPYLNGGLFRTNALEDSIEDKGEVTLPDRLFDPEDEDSVLGLLGRYRFTTQESTPDDQSVDPDPELLGRVFENLYQGDERHDSGTYYTPREIVQFMCRQVMDGYLRDSTGLGQDTLDWIRLQVTEPDEEKHALPTEKEEALVGALDRVRVCDPAVGSGAFLLGMMHEIVQLRRGIEHTKRHYIEPEEEDNLVTSWKRRAITWSLYGVDINPEAVEICQLRLWLSLVLDLKDPRKVEPLPNLDFRIVAGDSLVDRVADIVFGESLPRGVYQPPLEWGDRVSSEEQNIDRWRHEFEATQENPHRLRELRENVARAYQRIVRLHLEASLQRAKEEAHSHSGVGAKKKRASQLDARIKQTQDLLNTLGKDKSYQKPFLWPVAFPEAMNYPHNGFDIVLANPPYVRQEKLDQEDQRSYEQAFKDVYAGTADILIFFYARAQQILKPSGWLALITSNKYMRGAYGEKLRAYLSQKLILSRIIDFGDLPLFEANGKTVAAYPAVVIGKNHERAIDNKLLVSDLTYPVRAVLNAAGRSLNTENVRWVLEDISYILSENEIQDYPQVLLNGERWILERPELVHLFLRLFKHGMPLGKYVKGRMYRGITTGLNEAFIIDQAKRDELITENPQSAEIIKPWLRGRDVTRWQANWAGLYIIFTRRGTDIDKYPAVKEYLAWWKKNLEPKKNQGQKGPGRKPGSYKWFEIQDSTDYYEEFAEPKIVWKKTAFSPSFLFDRSGSLLGNTLHFIPGSDSWLVALMNSAIMEFLMVMRINLLRGGYIELTPDRIEDFPIPQVDSQQKTWLKELANKATLGDAAIENEINTITSRLFDLSQDEVQLIYDFLSRRELLRAEPDGSESEEDE